MDISAKKVMEWTRLGMRKALGPQLQEAAAEHEDLIVLTADVANSANLEGFRDTFGDRFYNLGISEMNMTGVACGLAKEGCNVFITSFTPFVTMRNYEAIRTLVGYMHLNVKIFGLASGLSLGVQGNTHFCLEDISLMRTIPGMLVMSPADVAEEAKCIEFLAGYEGPAYLRLTGIDGTPCVYRNAEEITLQGINRIREGEDLAILGTGSILSECVRAARALKKEELSCAVYDLCCLKPIDPDELKKVLSPYRTIVTVEEHHTTGGLGSLVLDEVGLQTSDRRLLKIGIGDYYPKAGDYAYLLKENGINAEAIKDRILSFMNTEH